MDEPRETTFRGKPATIYTWRRSMHYPDRWLAAAAGTIWTERGMVNEWEADRVWLVGGRSAQVLNAMRYW